MCPAWILTLLLCCLSFGTPTDSSNTTTDIGDVTVTNSSSTTPYVYAGDTTPTNSTSTSNHSYGRNVTVTTNSSVTGSLEGTTEEVEEEEEECELAAASIEWDNVQYPMIIALFLCFSALANIGYHHAGFLVTKIPETCVLIILGTLAGVIFFFASKTADFPEQLNKLEPHLFFMVLLPPIVLEASYSLHDRVFLDNLGTILTFAVVGTVVSFVIIGPLLWLLSLAGALPEGHEISFIHCMLFASIIVAVDPVAVLAIFQEVGVNSVLYFIVFGESLLNDAVTVVLYHTLDGMNCFASNGEEITAVMYVIAFVKFFTSSLGGIAIGMIFAALTALLTKFTVETRVVEPLILLTLGYLSYLTSELFGFSGIIGLTVCGLLQAQYAFHNISHKSYVTVKYFMKMASGASDSVIFLYLGVNLIRVNHEFQIGFIGSTIFLTLITRFVVTYILSAMLNSGRLRKITKREQLIMAYGGLRGAVAFSLVSLLDGKLNQQTQDLLMTTILVVIIFTVFVQGGTIKPLVSLLDIKTKEKNQTLSLFSELNANLADHIVAGVEDIVGHHSASSFYHWLSYMDDKYIKHALQRNPMKKDEKIAKLYEKIELKQYFAAQKCSEVAEKIRVSSSSGMEDDEAGSDKPHIVTVGDARSSHVLSNYGNRIELNRMEAKGSGQIDKKGKGGGKDSSESNGQPSQSKSQKGKGTEGDSPGKLNQAYSTDSDFYSGVEEPESAGGSREDIELGLSTPSTASTSHVSSVEEPPGKDRNGSLTRRAVGSNRAETGRETDKNDCQTRL